MRRAMENAQAAEDERETTSLGWSHEEGLSHLVAERFTYYVEI